MLRRYYLMLLLAVAAVSVVQGIPADDLSTEYGKRIVRQSKVADIKAMLNTEIQPCDDFYTYSCGNWHRNNPAQLLNNIMTDTFQLIAKGFDRRLKKLLESPDTKSDLEVKLKGFYQSCRLVHRDDVHYKLALKNVYQEYGEFPVLAGDQWNASQFVWWQSVGQIQHKYGNQIILAVDIMRDIKNSTQNKIYVGSPDFDKLSNSRILNVLEEARSAKDMEQYLGISSKQAKDTSKQIHDLEVNLMSGGSDVVGDVSLEDQLTLYSLIELQEKFGSDINFTEFLGLVLGPENVPKVIYIYDEAYLENTLKTLRSTPKSTVANYMLWELLEGYLLDADSDDLTKWCIEKTKNDFAKLVNQMVYAGYRNPETEAEVFHVWEQIRAVFRQELAGDKLDWITNSTRQFAIEKLDRMQLYINNYEGEDFESFYDGVTIDRINYVANVQNLRAAQANRTLAKLHGAPISLDSTEILSFTPAYNILENNISIPVALMQPRYFWNKDYPQAFTYGTLGYLLAHEMTHGFDDEGRNYDAFGNLASWWDYKSKYEFEEKRKCFQAQYHAYKYGGKELPESILQSENIADNAGIKLAYAAYKRWLEQQTPEILQQETLNGLRFNGDQLFFVAFAQLWCDDVQTLFKSSIASGDNHAPGMYRVIGSLSNFQEFSWVFNCSQSAPMDPEYKCAIY